MNERLKLISDRLKGKHVCANCFRDYAIRDFINSHLKWRSCTYCGRISSRRISASLSEVLPFVMDGVRSEWVVCTPQVEWEAENYDWHGGRDGWIRSDSMIQRVLPELKTTKGKLLKDIVDSIPVEWRPLRRYDPEPEDFFSYRWDEFAEAVKYHTRYIYYRVNTDWSKDVDIRNRNPQFKMRRMRSHVMEEVLDKISDLDITNTIVPGTAIWRVRIHKATKSFSKPEELGPPTFHQAVASRMSPAGIPVFYGSLERETAIVEKLDPEGTKKVSNVITIGKWKTLQEFRVLDLARIPRMPSLFDADRRGLRSTVSFLESFSDEISRPMWKGGREDIEYIPTQVFTEYIKHLYRDREGKGVDGILYKSAVRDQGVNCMLFIKSEDCRHVESIEARKTKPEQKMLLEAHERISEVEARLILPIPKIDTRKF